ncbi:MAG: hypothetical protein Tsb0015_01930 [Simkaniaceae bacterium]
MFSLDSFQNIRPEYQIAQKDLLQWLAKAHTTAESVKLGHSWSSQQQEAFYAQIYDRLAKLGLGEGKINSRGFSLKDPAHQDWQDMEIYNLAKHPAGENMGKRMAFYEKVTNKTLEELYRDKALPQHLIQVTCTGYVSPSAIQVLISGRKSKTYATHAFHMGCYGALAAIRMGMGLLDKELDIVHTEMCGLHMDPGKHEIGQLVSQTLFADGYIKYRLSKNDKGLRIYAVHEEIIPQTVQAMDWRIGSYGMQIFLDKEIPLQIKRRLPLFLKNLFQKANVPLEDWSSYYFAIHPGGPKIIEGIVKLLQLKETNVQHTRKILRDCGNMSSATLPHIWQSMQRDPTVFSGSKIVSLAFGPGLTIFGAILEKGETF